MDTSTFTSLDIWMKKLMTTKIKSQNQDPEIRVLITTSFIASTLYIFGWTGWFEYDLKHYQCAPIENFWNTLYFPKMK